MQVQRNIQKFLQLERVFQLQIGKFELVVKSTLQENQYYLLFTQAEKDQLNWWIELSVIPQNVSGSLDEDACKKKSSYFVSWRQGVGVGAGVGVYQEKCWRARVRRMRVRVRRRWDRCGLGDHVAGLLALVCMDAPRPALAAR